MVRVALSKLLQDLGGHGGTSTLGYAGPAGPRGGAVTWSPASHWPPGSAEPGVPRARSRVAATVPPDSSLSCSELSFVMHVPRQPPRVLGAVVVGGADQWITEPTLLWKPQRICVGPAHLVAKRRLLARHQRQTPRCPRRRGTSEAATSPSGDAGSRFRPPKQDPRSRQHRAPKPTPLRESLEALTLITQGGSGMGGSFKSLLKPRRGQATATRTPPACPGSL